MEVRHVLQSPKIPVEQCAGNALVVDSKIYTILMEWIEDCLLRVAQSQLPHHMTRWSMRSCRVHKQPIGLCGAWNRREPLVEDRELPHKGSVDGHCFRPKALHHRLREVSGHGKCLLHEATHGGHCARAENLLNDGLKGVSRVGIHEFGVIREADRFRAGSVGGDWVALVPSDPIDVRVNCLLHPTEHVIEGTVLQHQHHNGFDGLLLLGWRDPWES